VIRELCHCGHVKQCHYQNRSGCISCDCRAFDLKEKKRSAPTLAGKLRGIKKRLARKMDMNR
jgi:hypothetical protein